MGDEPGGRIRTSHLGELSPLDPHSLIFTALSCLESARTGMSPQKEQWHDQSRHGVFTWAVLDALNKCDTNGNGHVRACLAQQPLSKRSFMMHSSDDQQAPARFSHGDDSMHKTFKTVGITAATAALALFAYGASAQEKKAPAPAKKPPACSKLKEVNCTARTDCVFTAAVVDEKTKKTKTKASCKAAQKK